MTRIKVQYDAYNRTFRLVEKEWGALLDDNGVYELGIHIMGDELDEVADLAADVEMQVAHA